MIDPRSLMFNYFDGETSRYYFIFDDIVYFIPNVSLQELCDRAWKENWPWMNSFGRSLRGEGSEHFSLHLAPHGQPPHCKGNLDWIVNNQEKWVVDYDKSLWLIYDRMMKQVNKELENLHNTITFKINKFLKNDCLSPFR